MRKAGGHQGSLLGPLLFNLYVNDLQRDLNTSCFQYADDMTLYDNSSPRNLSACEVRWEVTFIF